MANLRGAYLAFAHDRPADWDFLRAWQPNVVRLMVQGSHTNPASVDVNRIRRVYEWSGGAQILLRCWDVDDRNGEAYIEMIADPQMAAQAHVSWWYDVIRRAADAGVPRRKLIAGLINEPNAHEHGNRLYDYTDAAIHFSLPVDLRLGVYCFSVGNPAKAGEAQFDWPYFARLEPNIVGGDHVVVLHEYMQPEGMYAVWTDAQGNERSDYGNLIGRHLYSGLTKANIIIGEWGIDGLLFNRHPHPQYGNNGWLSFRDLWGPERYADEYVECIRKAAPNVIGICPFISDAPSHQWDSFEVQTAYGALLSRKELCERETQPAQGGHTIHLPQVGSGPQTPTAEPTQPQPEAPQYPPGVIDPWALEAIMDVESGGRSFAGGRMVIRFEAHIFERELDDPGLFAAHFRYDAGVPWREQFWRRRQGETWTGIHTGSQDSEWATFEFARQLDETAAMRSISMGAPQIMGFNHARIGYPSPQAMFAAFGGSAFHQWAGLVNFILSSPELADALRRRDWREAARLYNGPGQVDAVSAQLADAYALMRGETKTA